MKVGLDVFLENGYKSFIGKRIGLVTNITGVNSKLISSIDLFYEHPDIHLTALYAPEHGIRGDAKEGEKVASMINLIQTCLCTAFMVNQGSRIKKCLIQLT